MSHPLEKSEALLGRHFNQMGIVLQKFVNADAEGKIAKVKLSANWLGSTAVAKLVGNECEPAMRNCGVDAQVAPVKDLGKGLWAWLGYREEWSAKGTAKYVFFSSSITVHFGCKSDKNKPQIFRAEWVGCQSGDVGHPHWQFDAVESLSGNDQSERAKKLLKKIRQNQNDEPGVRDFVPSLSPDDVSALVSQRKLSRIHFPSAAAWWKSSPHDDHVHSPRKCGDLQRWLRRCLLYLDSELDRLKQ